jgi:hypothetical protein
MTTELPQASDAPTSRDYFISKSEEHAALAQFRRWYQIYEAPNPERHFDIFASDFVLDTMNGTLQGIDAYAKRIKDFEGWQNAHHVDQASVRIRSESELELQADITYQNIRPDGQRFAYRLHYETVLLRRTADLPVFKSIKLRPTSGQLEDKTFHPAYLENRARSFTHHWLLLMEVVNGDPTRFRELLAPTFALDLGGPARTTTWDGFASWVNAVPSRIALSSHRIVELSVQPGPTADDIVVDLVFDWKGVAADDGRPMIARTQHHWQLTDRYKGRFAAMQDMQVKVLTPFQKS